MSDQAAAAKRIHGLVGPLDLTLSEIRGRGVPIRRNGEQILLGKNPPSDVVEFVKANKLSLLFELAAEETNEATGRLKPARVPTFEHEQYKADKDQAWSAMNTAFAAGDFQAWDLARCKWVVACKRLADPESLT